MPWISHPRIDRFIEIHEEGFYTGPDAERDAIFAHNSERHPDVPVYCFPSRSHAFKTQVPYPLDKVRKHVPFLYLEDSVSYMIALAIAEGVDEIGLWGINQFGKEYLNHKASTLYLVGLAQGKGIKVTVCPGSPLFASMCVGGRYGITVERRF